MSLPAPVLPLRPVTSFVRRSPRMNDSQRAAWHRLGQRFLVDGLARAQIDPLFVPQQPIDLATLFGRDAALLVEIGAGSGENLAAVAAARPSWNLLGFEVYDKVLGSAMSRLDRVGAQHVRLIQGDAVTGLQYLLQPGSVAEFHTYFPDPWHKTRHAKRRLISPSFAALVASRLAPGGLWRL
ncbi:MAG: tRNA (guanine(46)-N(7))-methyltransferase TrmB, partial [Propionibacteriaceae bacterium]|nr:tRNA (guanine(46)-N(7))-methyltransferase TrmB [Propionibacteriaceae bacterium]